MSAEESVCLQSFCPRGIDYQSQKDQNPTRVPNTCLWALENPKYLEWRDNDTKRLIWISADPGCGKSVLAKCLVDEDLPKASVNAKRKHVLYYFFKDTSPDQRSASRALCAVLHQLFRSCPRLIRHALPKYRERGDKLVASLPELWSIFMTVAADPTAGSMICVLDALDECDNQQRPKLIEYLGNFCCQQRTLSSASRLTFLITGRPYLDLRHEFRGAFGAVNDIELTGTDESAGIKKEIDLVIEHRIENLKHQNCLSHRNADHLRRRLLQVEHRTYLWLHLLFEIIQRTGSGTRSSMDSLINNLPKNVQEAYEILLERCPDYGFAKRVLQIVLVAARPLTLIEMDVALCIDDQTISEDELDGEGPDWLRLTLPSRCGLMISIIDSKVYFIHQTVKDFLLRKDGTQNTAEGAWQQSLDFQESHRALAKACLLNLSLRGVSIDETNHLNALLPEDHREVKSNVYCRQFSFLSYSAIYWADHYRKGFSDHRCNQLVKSFLRGNDQCSVVGRYGEEFGLVLHAASFGGNQGIVQILLDKGAEINAQCKRHGNALHIASFRGYQEIVQILLDKGAEVDAQSASGATALQFASRYGYQDIVRILLDNRANVNNIAN